MPNVHLIGGEKGGVGKSVVARLLAQYMIDRQIPFRAFDSDRSHGALLRFYRDYSVVTDIGEFESLDQIIESILEENLHSVIVDLAAQTSQFLDQWIEESGVAELAQESGITITYWHVMDSGRDSADLLEKLLDRYGNSLRYVVVLNQVRSVFFKIFDTHPARQKALDLGASLIPLRRLHPPLMTKIDGNDASFWGAMHWSEGETKFSLLERQRVKIWLKHAYESFDSLGISSAADQILTQ